MTFPHEIPEFPDLLEAVAAESPLRSSAMVEKDYWICHTLWALSRTGLQFWFKGGTSLSKAFGITERFSEDIDLVVLPGSIPNLPEVSSWRTETAGATASRIRYWEALLPQLEIPHARLELDSTHDPTQRGPGFRVAYPGHQIETLKQSGSVIRPYVLLEMSHGINARTARAPSLPRAITSFVHEWLASRGQLSDLADNRPQAVTCVHPIVTLIEKLDAITRRYHRADDLFEAAAFARHYEDAAKIVLHESSLPPITGTAGELAREMLHQRQIRKLVRPDDPALELPDPERRARIEAGYRAIQGMFWGPRIPLDEARGLIIEWLRLNPLTETR